MPRQHLARIGAGYGCVKHLAERGAGGCIGEGHGKYPLSNSVWRSRARWAIFSGMIQEAPMPVFDKATQTELEAAAFRRLVEHLRGRNDVQNIDMMNLAGFCRNCLSKWYRAAAEEKGLPLTDPEAREIIYGMPYKEWQAQHQKEASPEQKAKFAVSGQGQH
jgi:hypothetical protein